MYGQDEAAQEIFDTLGLSKHDVDLLYTAFWDIDADNSGAYSLFPFIVCETHHIMPTGSIRPIELFAYFEVEATTFEKGVFAIFDEGESGSSLRRRVTADSNCCTYPLLPARQTSLV